MEFVNTFLKKTFFFFSQKPIDKTFSMVYNVYRNKREEIMIMTTIKELERELEAASVKVIDAFKREIVESAEKTLRAWENGVNEFYRRHVDLELVDSYVELFGADREELIDLINRSYSISRITSD